MSPLNARLGFHYYPDDQHYAQSDLDIWLPRLTALGAHWVTLKASPTRTVPEEFILGLKEAGIEPIIHIPCRMGSVCNSELSSLLTKYAASGIRYVSVYDRPNLKSQWITSDWCRTGLVERFIDLLLPVLTAQQSAGLIPLFPPLEPGGDYWDTAFLEAALESLIRRGKQDLLNELVLSIYMWTNGKQLDWGTGGLSRWPEARPYYTPSGSQDQLGFRIFDWYSEVVEKSLHTSMPMLVIAGGELPSEDAQGIGLDNHAERNLAIARTLMTDDVPEIVLNFSFYLLASRPEHSDQFTSWYPFEHKPLPVINTFLRSLKKEEVQPKSSEEKPLKHYVLLPQRQYEHYEQSWKTIGPYALDTQPVVGFSPQEALLADQVTLLGDEAVISKEIEDQLGASGCIVKRYAELADGECIPDPSFSQSPSHLPFDAPLTGELNA